MESEPRGLRPYFSPEPDRHCGVSNREREERIEVEPVGGLWSSESPSSQRRIVQPERRVYLYTVPVSGVTRESEQVRSRVGCLGRCSLLLCESRLWEGRPRTSEDGQSGRGGADGKDPTYSGSQMRAL